MSQYQGSQAFNQVFAINEYVNKNTGSLVLSKSLVNLRGINQNIGLNINLLCSVGTAGVLSLPDNWSFGISYIIPGASLTCQGKTSVIDQDWADETGYQSGIRYVNDHGVKFEEVVPPQPLPSGQPGTFSYKFAYNDGACDYFDTTGKLVEHDDIFGNHINYFYTDQFNGVFGNYLDHIIDSFGQTITFGYNPDAVVIQLPDGSKTTINYSSRGIENIVDALGYHTVFDYTTIANVSVVSSIKYPTGLVTQVEYTTIPYLASGGEQKSFPAVSELTHLNADGEQMDNTVYAYGTATAGNTYTGASAGYILSSNADGLMDSNNTGYQYDVLVKKLDRSRNLLMASIVYYNYLHLPLRTEQYLVDESSGTTNGYQTCNTYVISPDWHARTTNYSKPVATEQFVWSPDDSKYIPMQKSTGTYDNYGHIIRSEELLYDRTQKTYIIQMAGTYTYTVASWGGEMPESTIYQDNVSGYQRKIDYTLTSDQKNINSGAIQYKAQPGDNWNPWKTKTYDYDQQGRLTSVTLSWSQGSSHDPGSISSTTEKYAYAYDDSNHILQVTVTDALGNNTNHSYDVRLKGGPVVKLESPLKEVTAYEYDALGRVIKQTDPEGYVTETTYNLEQKAGYNSTVVTDPTGYIVENYLDAQGRKIKVMDNGDPTKKDGSEINRTLSQTSYNALGKVSQSIDELGLISRYKYDSLGRLRQSTDPLGNVNTVTFNDANLSSSQKTNGVLRQVTQKDGLGRTLMVNKYPDPGDPSITYYHVYQIQYNGMGQKVEVDLNMADIKSGKVIGPLSKFTFSYDADSRVVTESFVGYEGSQVQSSRTTIYDLLGNELSYNKQTVYPSGKIYKNSGNTLTYNEAGQLISITDPLGQVEKYTYNADGRLQKRTRFDGTEFTYSYNKNGPLSAMKWGDNSIDYTYYKNCLTKTISDGSATVSYEYYLDGSAKSVTYPNGKSQSYQLDQYSRVIGQTDVSGAVTTNSFNDMGQLNTREHGSDKLSFTYGTVNHTKGVMAGIVLSGGSTLNRQYQYDGFGQLSAAVVSNEGKKVVLAATYKRDPLGRLLDMTVSSDACSEPAVNLHRTFTYDGLNQLTAFNTTYNGNKLPAEEVTFSYDGNSNVLSRVDNGRINQYQYNALDQLQQPGVVYDRNGRMTADGSGNQYSYDELDKLMQVTANDGNTVTHSYYPDEALATRVVGQNKQQFYYNGGSANAVASSAATDIQADAVTWTTFLFGGSERMAAYEANQSPSYYMTANGSTSLIYENSDQFKGFNYDSFGTETNNPGIGGNKSFTWNQEYADPTTCLVYLRARFYNPRLMSFMTMDSSLLDNRYAYCSGDPINLTDPTGHSAAWEIVGLVAGAVVGIAATVLTGGAAGAAAAAIFGTECTEASVAVTAFAGAAGAVAGDATSAGISGQKFTGTRALIDIASGAAGSVVGAGVGGGVGRAAMRTALNSGLSQRAITNIGLISSGLSGGIAGSLAAAGVTAGAYHQPFFSVSTAISLAVGAATGVGGGFLTSGAYLGKVSSKLIPVPLTDTEVTNRAIVPAIDNLTNGELLSKLLVMAPQDEANASATKFNNQYGNYNSALTLDYGPSSTTYDTIAAHGAGNTIFASVDYGGTGAPNYVRPITGKRFATYLRNNPELIGGDSANPLKLMSCFGAFFNARTIANALQRDVFAGYSKVDRYSFTNWKRFTPR